MYVVANKCLVAEPTCREDVPRQRVYLFFCARVSLKGPQLSTITTGVRDLVIDDIN